MTKANYRKMANIAHCNAMLYQAMGDRIRYGYWLNAYNHLVNKARLTK